jgi:hypothetical protein
MATVTLNATNSNTITITLASLANNTAVASSAIDNSTNKFLEAVVRVKVKTNAAGTSATGVVNVYLVRSTDGGTDYADSTNVLLGSIPAIANATTYARDFDAPRLGTHWKIAVENRSGAALDSTGGSHEAEFAGIKYDVA